MAVSFGEQIHALTGFDGDSASASEIGENYDDMTAEWMNVAIKEIINILPPKLKQKCSKVTNLYIGNTDTTMDLDGLGEILYVTRENADSGYYIGCREVSPLLADSANDSSSLHYATATDPVYWTESNSSGNPTLFVKPTPTANQPAKVMHISYPVFDADGSGTNVNIKTATSISNFPDEAESLVVLKAAIIAAEYQLAIEEDVELYAPIIANLKQEYQQGVLALQSGSIVPPQQKGAK
tara:strand:+ start:40 stop:756 length:717 start_codon:yes stop_codon:yes gene_type:complete